MLKMSTLPFAMLFPCCCTRSETTSKNGWIQRADAAKLVKHLSVPVYVISALGKFKHSACLSVCICLYAVFLDLVSQEVDLN